MQLSLASLAAPKLGRAPGIADEQFAWDSREFLRKKCIGKQVRERGAFVERRTRNRSAVLPATPPPPPPPLRTATAYVCVTCVPPKWILLSENGGGTGLGGNVVSLASKAV